MTRLDEEIRFFAEHDGPVPFARVMEMANRHYYATRDPLGRDGDFTTSPEISQTFGELIGIWAAMAWHGMGRPDPFNLVELGPGRGTLMADALRAIGSVAGMRGAAAVHLVETSPALRARQAETLERFRVPLAWHDDIGSLPEGPFVLIANEFFDALPIHQYVRRPEGWRERAVGLFDGRLQLGLSPAPVPPSAIPSSVRDAPVDQIVEVCPAGIEIMSGIAHRLARNGGAALIVDYGHARTGTGETLQAVRDHTFVDPLVELGEADLTAHVDFQALATAARAFGAEAHGPITQRDLLLGLGLAERTQMLCDLVDPDAAATLASGAERLIDPATTGMGSLFKALALTAPGMPVPPPFFDPLTAETAP